jgi:hypothetical protein
VVVDLLLAIVAFKGWFTFLFKCEILLNYFQSTTIVAVDLLAIVAFKG